MGPRGISVIERLAAHLNARDDSPALNLHLIDDAQFGAGRIWDTEQTQTLCMNTLVGAGHPLHRTRLHHERPVLEDPIQYEWIQLLRREREGISPEKQALFDAHPVTIGEYFRAEIEATRSESNPSRVLYGAYRGMGFRCGYPETMPQFLLA